jgi:hypothetical protein
MFKSTVQQAAKGNLSVEQTDDQLVPDNCGVLVENDMDRRRLLWLASKIGEVKLRASAQKYRDRYPASLPYVSLLLKWYRLKVPTAVYAPVRSAVYSVYMLELIDGSAIKVGYSSCWTQRASSLVPQNMGLAEIFDIDRSLCAAAPGKSAATSAKKSILAKTIHLRCEAPIAHRWGQLGVVWGAGGHSEWRSGQARSQILALLIDHACRSAVVTLRTALAQDAQLAGLSAEIGSAQ